MQIKNNKKEILLFRILQYQILESSDICACHGSIGNNPFYYILGIDTVLGHDVGPSLSSWLWLNMFTL